MILRERDLLVIHDHVNRMPDLSRWLGQDRYLLEMKDGKLFLQRIYDRNSQSIVIEERQELK